MAVEPNKRKKGIEIETSRREESVGCSGSVAIDNILLPRKLRKPEREETVVGQVGNK